MNYGKRAKFVGGHKKVKCIMSGAMKAQKDYNKAQKNYYKDVETVCCICGKTFKGMGNNPSPVRNEGLCCDECNVSIVLHTRLLQLRRKK